MESDVDGGWNKEMPLISGRYIGMVSTRSGDDMARRKQLPETAYYYCSIETFMNIWDKGKIWLQDISKSNDSEELSWGRIQLEYELSRLHRNNSEVDSYSERYPVAYFWQLLEENVCCAMCFSGEKDRLSQWRGYGSDGAGVALGFDTQYLQSSVVTEKSLRNMRFETVGYRRPQINKRFLRQILKEYDRTAPELFNHPELEERALFDIAFHKNPGFREEDECRLAVWLRRDDVKIGSPIVGDKGIYKESIKYSAKDGQPVLHIEVPIDREEAIKEIVLGPSCKASRDDIIDYCRSISKCNNLIISESRTSYRPQGSFPERGRFR